LYTVTKYIAPILKDSYGVYPLIPTETLRFEIRNTFQNPRTDTFGINGIALYDHQGEEIRIDAVSDFSISGRLNCTNMEVLLKEEKATIEVDEMFTATTKWEINPVFKIVFKVPTRITKLVFWNYNSVGEHRHCGVSRGKFLNDYGTIWVGNIQEASGNALDAHKHLTTILFTEVPIKRKYHFDYDHGVDSKPQN